MNEVFKIKHLVDFRQCDRNKRIKNSTLSEIFSEIAGYQLLTFDLPYQKLIDNGLVFLLIGLSVEFSSEVNFEDEIEISTWASGFDRLKFLRCFEVHKKDKKTPAVRAKSNWVLVNPETRKILRPTDFPFTIPLLESKKFEDLEILKIQDKIGFHSAGLKIPRFSEIDANNHINNSNYSDIALDYIPHEYANRRVKSFRINFIKETNLSDELEIFVKTGENFTQVYGVSDGKVRFESETVYF